MAFVVDSEDFVVQYLAKKPLLIDTRSPAEFEQAHIPGAVNIPLLNNEERVQVGTCYKKKGREEAVLLGFDLVGKKFADFIRAAKKHTNEKDVFVYCWRGGMRSNIFSYVLNMGGFNVTLMKGGYKSFRNFVLQTLNRPKNIKVLGGKTGCGKSEILKAMNSNVQVIDLEDLAHHKGSAFGSLGLPPQPTNEFFENKLALQWHQLRENENVWLENESRLVGKIKIPDAIYNAMQTAPLYEICLSKEERIKRILNEYGCFSIEELTDKTMKVKNRMDGALHKLALIHLQENNMTEWASMMIDYYDKKYDHGKMNRVEQAVKTIEQKSELNISEVIAELLKD